MKQTIQCQITQIGIHGKSCHQYRSSDRRGQRFVQKAGLYCFCKLRQANQSINGNQAEPTTVPQAAPFVTETKSRETGTRQCQQGSHISGGRPAATVAYRAWVHRIPTPISQPRNLVVEVTKGLHDKGIRPVDDCFQGALDIHAFCFMNTSSRYEGQVDHKVLSKIYKIAVKIGVHFGLPLSQNSATQNDVALKPEDMGPMNFAPYRALLNAHQFDDNETSRCSSCKSPSWQQWMQSVRKCPNDGLGQLNEKL